MPFPISVWGVLRGGARSAENHLQACPLMILLHWMPILDPPPGCPCLRGGGVLSELGYQAQVCAPPPPKCNWQTGFKQVLASKTPFSERICVGGASL